MAFRNWQTQSIKKRTQFFAIALTNAQSDAEVADALEAFGYDSAKLQAAQQQLAELQELIRLQVVHQAEKFKASQQVQITRQAAGEAYIRTLKLARIALKGNTKEQIALGLHGRRKRTLDSWLSEAELFYHNIRQSETAKAAMQNFRYTDEKWTAEAALVDAVVEAVREREIRKGEAQNTTRIKNRKMKEMDAWMQDFVAVARIALEAHPQWLEKLGIFVRS